MTRILSALLCFMMLLAPAGAQNQILVPTRPLGDSTNAAASTAFVQQNKGASVLSQQGVDPSGVTDSTTGINNAMAAVGNGLLFWPKGTYKVSSSLVKPNGQQWLCESTASVTIQWSGANTNDVVQISQSFFGGISSCTIDVLTATGMTAIHIMDSQNEKLWGINLQSTGTVSPSANSIGLNIEAGHFATGAAHNAAFNDIVALKTNFYQVGIQIFGISTGPTVATLNTFSQTDVENCTNCTRLAQWVDTNTWYHHRVSMFANNSNGVVFNDSGTPGSDVGVYNNNFYGLSCDAFGGITGVTCALFNVSKENNVYAMLVSPDPGFNGNTFVDNMGRAQSYSVVQSNLNDGTNNMKWFTKNLFYRQQILPFGNAGTALPQASTSFVGVIASGTEAFTQFLCPVTGTFKNLFILSSAPAAGQTIANTLRVNGTDTALTCTITGTGTTCNDTTHTVPCTAGQPYDLKVITSATTGPIANFAGGVEYDNP